MVFVFLGTAPISSHAQVRDQLLDSDISILSYDEIGWRLYVSAGTVLFDSIDIMFDDTISNAYNDGSRSGFVVKRLDYSTTADLKEPLFPALTLGIENKSLGGLTTDFKVVYFIHDIDGTDDDWRYQVCPSDEDSCTEANGSYEGIRRNIAGLAGGTYYFNNVPIITPYIHGNVGVSNSFVTLDFGDDFGEVKDFQLTPVMQAGGGFDINVGPIVVGAIYNYLFLAGQEFEYSVSHGDDVDVNGQINMGNTAGHGFVLKIGVKNSIF